MSIVERKSCMFPKGGETFSTKISDGDLSISGIRKLPEQEIGANSHNICLARNMEESALGVDPKEDVVMVYAGICLRCKSRVGIVVCNQEGDSLKHPIEE